MGKVIANYLETVCYLPTYADLAGKADILYQACQNLYQKRRLANLHKAI